MKSDKILIIIAAIIFLTASIFKRNIVQEIKLLKETEVLELASIYFHPLSTQERIDIIKENIIEMTAIQKQISNSMIAKHFFGYQEIQEVLDNRKKVLEEEVNSLKQYGNFVSFSTSKLHSIITNTQFSKEQLYQLADLIDEIFPDDEIETLELDWESNCPVLNIENFNPNKRNLYQTFINCVSKDIFQNKPAFLHVALEKSDKMIIFRSHLCN